jgi:hypothetical protein
LSKAAARSDQEQPSKKDGHKEAAKRRHDNCGKTKRERSSQLGCLSLSLCSEMHVWIWQIVLQKSAAMGHSFALPRGSVI